MMRNKKGEIEGFITWVLAFSIIFVMLGLFLLGIINLSTWISKDTIEIKNQRFANDDLSTLEFYPDNFRTQSLINVFEINDKEISDWVDDGNFLTWWDIQGTSRKNQNLEEYPITEEDKIRILAEQEKLKQIFSDYFNQIDVKEPVLYIYSGKKRLIIMKSNLNGIIAINPRIPEPQKDAVPFEDIVLSNQDQGRLVHVKFLKMSENGNLYSVLYFDKSDGTLQVPIGI